MMNLGKKNQAMEVLISAEKYNPEVCICTHTNLKHQRSYNEDHLFRVSEASV